MALAKVIYTTDGVQLSFPITFPYMDVLHIKVFKNTVLQAVGTGYTIVGGSVVFVAAPSGGQTLEIKRVTQSASKVVTFHDASVLTAVDQEAANTQLFYLAQESLDSSTAMDALANAADVAIAAATRAENAAAAAAVSHSGEFYADNTGTPDAIVVAYPTAPNTLTDGYRLTLGLPAPNVTTTPTVVISLGGISQPPRGMVKANAAGWATLVAGDLQGDVDIRYDLPNTRWIVMNPAKPVVFTATGATDPVPLAQVQSLLASVQALIPIRVFSIDTAMAQIVLTAVDIAVMTAIQTNNVSSAGITLTSAKRLMIDFCIVGEFNYDAYYSIHRYGYAAAAPTVYVDTVVGNNISTPNFDTDLVSTPGAQTVRCLDASCPPGIWNWYLGIKTSNTAGAICWKNRTITAGVNNFESGLTSSCLVLEV